ncbi:MAG: hypothetical protein A3G81_25145 [Betaproteobacteria bacterium RIFCSPLOWO2_12_FULL_65_14]|nr:MAG: hypothetical protein A3G81_25145 [Betaproteobacteria bacterium RIFCSPLOWO2_12_FULL_65_14]
MFSTLFARLAAALVALSLVLSAALVLVLRSSHQSFHLEVEQRLHQQLARRLADRIADDEKTLEAVFAHVRELATLNPVLAAYVVDVDGNIVASSRPRAEIRRSRVSVAPILDFVKGPAAWPLLGDDPASERGKAVFSAASVTAPPQNRFLYVVLGSTDGRQAAIAAGERSHSLREALELALANVAAALLATLVVVRVFTRPVRRLRRAMEAFDQSGFAGTARYHAQGRQVVRDEIDRLGAIFDSMADRIAMQIGSLRRSDEARREMYANISHDLQTPLTALRGYVDTLLMKDGTLSAAQRRRFLDILSSQTQQLADLVEQVVDLARLEAPELRLQSHEIRIERLLERIVEELRPLLEKKGLHLRLETAVVDPVRGDEALLRRALNNVILNAIQAAPEASEIGIRAGNESGNNVAVVVSDRGPGLSSEQIPRVFNRHYRGSRDAAPGMGLGLAIARKVVELHGGDITAGNAEGGGAQFRITLPSSVANT